MKTCFKCKRSLPVREFYRHPEMGDGRLGKCKTCTRSDVAGNRLARRGHYLAYDRARTKGRRKAVWAASSVRAGKHRANTTFGDAVRGGKIKRPERCSLCGEGGKIHGHHEDYRRPLVVMWVCIPCHKSIHAKKDGKMPWRLKSLGLA